MIGFHFCSHPPTLAQLRLAHISLDYEKAFSSFWSAEFAYFSAACWIIPSSSYLLHPLSLRGKTQANAARYSLAFLASYSSSSHLPSEEDLPFSPPPKANNSLEASRPDLKVAYLESTLKQTSGSRSQYYKRAGRRVWKSSRIPSWRRAMIRRKQAPPSLYLSTPSPETSPRASLAISDWDADDEGTMSAEDSVPPQSLSLKTSRQTSDFYNMPSRPTLADVLSNSAPPPWTLSAFTAYLSQNHCLENLEFTMDAERYRQRYEEILVEMSGIPTDCEESDFLRSLWQRLLDAYIIPDGAREINIPSNIRQRLLSLPNHTSPPEPDVLGAAVKIIFDLMEESVLVSFLNEVPSPAYNEQWNESDENLSARIHGSRERIRRSRSRNRTSPPASSLDVPGSPHAYSPGRLATFPSKSSRAASHFSSGSGDASSLTDDSASPSSPNREPMTPPTTPPSSDFGGSSPRSRGDNTWKKMLVWKKKSSNGMRDSRFPTIEDWWNNFGPPRSLVRVILRARHRASAVSRHEPFSPASSRPPTKPHGSLTLHSSVENQNLISAFCHLWQSESIGYTQHGSLTREKRKKTRSAFIFFFKTPT